MIRIVHNSRCSVVSSQTFYESSPRPFFPSSSSICLSLLLHAAFSNNNTVNKTVKKLSRLVKHGLARVGKSIANPGQSALRDLIRDVMAESQPYSGPSGWPEEEIEGLKGDRASIERQLDEV